MKPWLRLWIALAVLIAMLTPRICFGAQAAQFTPSLLAEPFAKVQRADYPPPGDRLRHTPRSGVLILHIDPKNGQVESITIEKRSGDELFDRLWLKALVTWKFKPNTVANVRVPVMSISGMRIGHDRGLQGPPVYIP